MDVRPSTTGARIFKGRTKCRWSRGFADSTIACAGSWPTPNGKFGSSLELCLIARRQRHLRRVRAIDFLEFLERLVAEAQEFEPYQAGFAGRVFGVFVFKRAGDVFGNGFLAHLWLSRVNEVHFAFRTV